MPRRYSDFDLLIEHTEGRYRARLFRSLGGEATADLSTPWPDPGLEKLLATLGRPIERHLRPPVIDKSQLVQQIGDRLFRWLFIDGIEHCWRQSLGLLRERDRGLRLRLRLSEVPDLARLPWEYLYDPVGNRFIDSPETPLVRYLEVQEPIRPHQSRPRLHVLVLAAGPSGTAPLDAAAERRQIAGALEALKTGGRIVVDHLEPTTLTALTARLEHKPYQVLHFIGHGIFELGPGGALMLEGEQGSEQKVGAAHVAALLRSHQSLRLVVLNSCEGARTAVGDAFAGVAQGLVRQGIPAVVAMQYPISDRAAVAFASHFYDALAQSVPIDGAVAQARQTMRIDHHETEWGTPVLYLRAPDGRIFDQPESPSATPASLVARPRLRFSRRQLGVGAGTAVSALLLTLLLSWRSGVEGWVRREWPATAALLNPEGCASPPGLGISFARIEPGGSQAPYCLGIFEVTNGQWHAVMEPETELKEDDDLPKVFASWTDVQKFIEKLNELDSGRGYRLPTDKEWELAARADTTTDYSFGSDPAELHLYGNCKNKPWIDGYESPAPVGSFRPNRWGLYDVHGNAWEWVQDVYDPALPAPPDPERARRGGGFNSLPKDCVSASRHGLKPGAEHQDSGLRLARDVG